MMNVEWNYFNKFEQMNKFLLPATGEGLTMANQIFTAVNKLVYKWYNDGDVFDNVHSDLKGWANDLTSYANWLHKYCGDEVQNILEGINGLYCDEQYEELLKDLADTCLDIDFILKGKFASRLKEGSVYNCDGPFEYSEHPGYPDYVEIDYDGTFVITTDEDGYDCCMEWFDDLDDAINWCEEKGIDYDITEDAERQGNKPEFLVIMYDEETGRFTFELDRCDNHYYDDYWTDQTFYNLSDAEDFLDGEEIDYELSDEAMAISESEN